MDKRCTQPVSGSPVQGILNINYSLKPAKPWRRVKKRHVAFWHLDGSEAGVEEERVSASLLFGFSVHSEQSEGPLAFLP